MTTAPDFPLLGEPLALDLVNTRMRRDGAALDLLATPVALTAWLRAEHQRVAWTGRAAKPDLMAVQTLRDAIALLLQASSSNARPPTQALHTLNQALANSPPPLRLLWTATGPSLAPPAAGSRLVTLLRALATDAVSLLTGSDAGRVRICAHPDCILQFVARNPRRRWCSSTGCGNRARVAQHYLRQHEER